MKRLSPPLEKAPPNCRRISRSLHKSRGLQRNTRALGPEKEIPETKGVKERLKGHTRVKGEKIRKR